MAAKKDNRRNNAGGGNLATQIATLEAAVGAKGIKAAKAIVADHDPKVIALAFKRCPKGQTQGLGSRIEAMLANLPAAERETTRASLMKTRA